jgi:hypothetical protein
MPRGRVRTAEVEEASVVVVLAVVATSAAGAAGLDQLEAVSVAVASTQRRRCSVELRTSQVGLRPSEAKAGISRVELAWGRSGRTPFLDRAGSQIMARRFQVSHAIVVRSLHLRMLREHFSNAD